MQNKIKNKKFVIFLRSDYAAGFKERILNIRFYLLSLKKMRLLVFSIFPWLALDLLAIISMETQL